MTASFAAYASQFISRHQPSSLASSQPLFFSFTDDGGDDDDDQPHAPHRDTHAADLDDLDDPHLRASAASTHPSVADRSYAHGAGRSYGPGEGDVDDNDDPYLRLDEDDHAPLPGASSSASRYDPHRAPLLASHALSDIERSRGWLAHQPSPLRTPSPAQSSSSSADSADSGNPPADLLDPTLARAQHRPTPPTHAAADPIPPPPRTIPSLSLTASLLPRDGRARPLDVFSLPDPRHTAHARARRKYHDALWTALWCTGLSACLLAFVLVLFLTRRPAPAQHPGASLPYTTLLHTVPLLTVLTFVSAAVSYAHIFLLRVFVKPVVIATTVFVPVTLFLSAVWAFVGSFMWDGDTEPTWGESWGLRLFSLVPLALALLTARRLLHLPRTIHSTSTLLTLTTSLLAAHPLLLALSPLVLLAALLASLPFLTLAFRLLLIGYFTRTPAAQLAGWEWHVHGWAGWAIAATVGVWLWSWGIARGVLRVTTAGVIGAWYFADPDLPPPPPTSTHALHAALHRATAPALGTIALSALLASLARFLALLTLLLRRAPTYLPPPLRAHPLAGALLWAAGVAAGYCEERAGRVGRYALVYVGLTGDAFWVSARRAGELVAGGGQGAGGGGAVGAKYKKRFKTEPPLTLLTIAPLTLTFPAALAAYLFVAHTLGAPGGAALEAALLAGGVTALVGLFCVGLVRDTADTLYLCYCIDRDVGERRRAEVFEMFEYDPRRGARVQEQAQARYARAPQQQQQQQSQARGQRAPLARAAQSQQHQQPSQPLPQQHQRHREQHQQQHQQPQPRQPISQRVQGMASPSPSLSPSEGGGSPGGGRGGGSPEVRAEARFTGRGKERRAEQQQQQQGRVVEQEREYGEYGRRGEERREEYAREHEHDEHEHEGDVDPFLRAYTPEIQDEEQGYGYGQGRSFEHRYEHHEDSDEDQDYDHDHDHDQGREERTSRAGHVPPSSVGMSGSVGVRGRGRDGRDEEEGLGAGAGAGSGAGSGMMSGLFPPAGSDLF